MALPSCLFFFFFSCNFLDCLQCLCWRKAYLTTGETCKRAKLISFSWALQNRLNQHSVCMDVISSDMHIKCEATELRNKCCSLFQQLIVIISLFSLQFLPGRDYQKTENEFHIEIAVLLSVQSSKFLQQPNNAEGELNLRIHNTKHINLLETSTPELFFDMHSQPLFLLLLVNVCLLPNA